MNNESYYGVTRTDEYLAHYGVRGMKWGVRKARESGNMGALGRQYKKAQKKLAKLEKRAAKADKYSKLAKRLAVGAALTGGAAAVGTHNLGNFMQDNAKVAGTAVRGAGSALVGAGQLVSRIKGGSKVGGRLVGTGYRLQSKGKEAIAAVGRAGGAVKRFGNSTAISDAMIKGAHGVAGAAGKVGLAGAGARAYNRARKGLEGVSNNTMLRIGSGAASAGMAAGAAYNAYRAKTAKKQAQRFRSEMNKAFAGTQYDRRRKKNRRG